MKMIELNGKSTAELTKLLVETQKSLVDSRRSLAAGELVNPRVITTARKDIARIKTAMSATVNKEEEK